MATCPVQWLTVRKGGDPKTDQATKGADSKTPGLATQRERGLNCHQTVLSNQRGLQRTKRGGGPKTPLCKGKGPEDPGVVAPFAVADCRGNRMRAVVCASTRWSMSLLCCATEFRRYSQ